MLCTKASRLWPEAITMRRTSCSIGTALAAVPAAAAAAAGKPLALPVPGQAVNVPCDGHLQPALEAEEGAVR